MKRKKKKLVTKEINFLLLVLAFILAVGIIATKKYNPTKQIAEVIQETNIEKEEEIVYDVPTERPENVPEDWILYTNDKVGFSFYYDPAWRITQDTNKSVTLFKSGDHYRGLIVSTVERNEDTDVYNTFKQKYIEKAEGTKLISVSGYDTILIDYPFDGVPYFAYIDTKREVLLASLIEGGEISPARPNSPQVREDIDDYFSLLNSFQFASK